MINICVYNANYLFDRNIISVFNASFLYGINCFEGIRAYWNSDLKKLLVFDLDEHLNRLYDSISFLMFENVISKNELKSELLDLLSNGDVKENVYIRITFFIDGETSWADQNMISRVISVRSMASQLGSADAISLTISDYRRISNDTIPPAVKAGANYLNSRYALLDAKSKGFEGALFLNKNNYISESTGSCVFFIRGNVLYTPAVDCDILVGITRNRIIQLARENSIEFKETNIKVEDLDNFQAAFLVGTMIELKPISRIGHKFFDLDDHITKRLTKLLYNYVYGI